MGVSKSVRHILIDMVRRSHGPGAWAEHDPVELAREAQRQGVLSACGADVPGEFQAARVREAVKSTRLLDAALRVQWHLERYGLRTIALKGAALHGTVYSNVDERPMLDADLWVIDDFAAAETRVAALGFHPIDRADHAVAYEEEGSGAVVELHRSVTSAPGFFRVDAASVWSARRRLSTGLVAPSSVDTFVLLALHSAFQHGLVLRLVQHGDFEALLLKESPEPARIVSRAREWDAGVAVAAAMDVAAHVRGRPVAAEAVRIALGPLPRCLGRHVERARMAPEEFLEPARPRLAFVRLALARGRRFELLRRTLWSDADAHTAPALSRVSSGLTRGARLARRHLWPKMRAAS